MVLRRRRRRRRRGGGGGGGGRGRGRGTGGGRGRGRGTAQLACRQYYNNSTVTGWFKWVQQNTLTEQRCGVTVASRLAKPVTPGSNPSLYHIFLFLSHKVFTRLGIRLGLGLVFLG